MSVTETRPEYDARLAGWRLVRDAVAGAEAVKAGGHVLPVNPLDRSPENRSRNESRVKAAVYFNATGRTLQALSGMAFAKWPEFARPAALDYLLNDATGSGVGLLNQAQKAVAEVMQTGRAGLLVDYPASGGAVSVADAEQAGVRPSITLYPAEAVTNWRVERIGARSLLSLVVLAEQHEEWYGFERKVSRQFRVLRLEAGQYRVEVWREGAASGWQVVERYAPSDASGQPLREIPFTFIGAANNDAEPDVSPLYDLADLNIAHFRNSADHEESLFFAGQAQVWVTGADEEWLKLMQEAGIYVGSRAIGVAPQNGSVTMLQAQPVGALAEEMRHKVELMAQLGARLMQAGTVSKTATQASGEEKAAHSALSLVCDNVSDAYRFALRWCARFIGASEGEVDFTISTEFTGLQFDPAQLAQALAAVQAGKLPESDFWTYMRAIGLIRADKSDDEVRDEVEAQGVNLVAGLDDGDA